jgi:hypothetical protein
VAKSLMSASLQRFLCTFRSWDNCKCTAYVISHSLEDAAKTAKEDPNAKEILEVKLIEDVQPKVKSKTGWISDCLPVKNQLLETLEKLHKG